MKAWCYSKMTAVGISDLFKIMPHRLHISLYVRLSRWRWHAVCCAALLYAAPLVVWGGGEGRLQTSRSATFLYLACFATHFGTQMWMTCISGIVLFLNLPRKVFGQVQRYLFPKYFLINSVLGFVTLAIFVLHNPREYVAQRWILALCLVCELLGMLRIVPDMIQTMAERATIEEAAGVGQDVVGRFRPTAQLNSIPEYARLHARFRRLHGLCASVNLLAMACNVLHLYHLACKLVDR